MMNETEFEEQLERHRSLLEAFCYKSGAPAEDQKDLLQDIWMQAWTARASFKGKSSFRTWLHRVAVSVLVTNHSRKKRVRTIYPERLPDVEELTNEGSDNADELKVLDSAVQQLKKKEKDLIDLYLEDRSHRQIAAIINTTENNVAAKFKRIKAKLRKLLNGKQ